MREVKKTKAELGEMLAEAVRNTQPEPVRDVQPEPQTHTVAIALNSIARLVA
jgi:hypothetical protein